MKYPEHWPEFFTATILQWQHLLAYDKYKAIIINSLKFLVDAKRINVYAFVLMSNHLHLIWQALHGYSPDSIQHSLLSYSAKKILFDVEINHPQLHSLFLVNAKDREYQVWERNSLGIELFTNDVFVQKIDYIHNNPVKANIVDSPEKYYYSSARFYAGMPDEFGILTRYE